MLPVASGGHALEPETDVAGARGGDEEMEAVRAMDRASATLDHNAPENKDKSAKKRVRDRTQERGGGAVKRQRPQEHMEATTTWPPGIAYQVVKTAPVQLWGLISTQSRQKDAMIPFGDKEVLWLVYLCVCVCEPT